MSHKFIGIWVFFVGLFTLVHCKTDSDDVSALNVMFTSLNSPKKLSDWQSSGGDPCGDSWKGIECSSSSVTEIKLSGMKLSGSLGYKLSSLSSLTYFDLSDNKISGEIPYQLPANLEHLDLSNNDFTGSVPYSISQISNLKHLDLSNNQLNGQLNDVFNQLHNLDFLDLSKNQLTGNLPQSLGSLSSLSSLYLQKNQFTGQINMLAKLKLNDLNLANNHFSGWLPNELTKVKNLDIEGNSWSSGPAPPGMSSSDRVPSTRKKGRVTAAVIAVIIIGLLVVIATVIAIVSKKKRASFSSNILDEQDSVRRKKSFSSYGSSRYSKDWGRGKTLDRRSIDSACSIDIKSLQSSGPVVLKPSLSSRTKSLKNNDSGNITNSQTRKFFEVVSFTLTDLQTATNNFATSRFLGEGSIGRVYKAKFADGKVLAVKKINSSFFQDGQAGNFIETISSITKLRHPNIAEVVGYCTEQGHNMLVYDYYINGSLHKFLHLSDEFSKPLTWNTRVRIALGTAQALEYLHETCFPPFVHRSIKSSNILLDMELNPRLFDCGLATFYQDANENIAVGYNAPECTKGSAYTPKSDVYSFGIVMLELLAGRKPFDSSLPVAEQFLVQWATPQLHDIDALDKMVDPALRGLYPPKSISLYADIIALCVQVEPEYRPPMSKVVQSLERVTQCS